MSGGLAALRERVALTPVQEVAAYRLRGEAAFDVLDRLVTTDLYLQPAQLGQALILDDEGLVVADALVGREDDGYLLVIDALDAASVAAVEAGLSGVRSERLSDTHQAIGLHGPFAWELCGEWLGPDVVGMPYLSSFWVDDVLLLRAGNTGEYGYEAWLPRERAGALRASLVELGARFDAAEAGLDALSLAALENGFFNVRGEGRRLRDPLELQLRWRLSNDKHYRGRPAVTRRMGEGIARRVTWLRCDVAVEVGDRVAAFGEDIGDIVHAAWSERLGSWVGIACLRREWAHAGIDAYERVHHGERAPLRTVAPPLCANSSLRVSPQRHSYRRHAELGLGAAP